MLFNFEDKVHFLYIKLLDLMSFISVIKGPIKRHSQMFPFFIRKQTKPKSLFESFFGQIKNSKIQQRAVSKLWFVLGFRDDVCRWLQQIRRARIWIQRQGQESKGSKHTDGTPTLFLCSVRQRVQMDGQPSTSSKTWVRQTAQIFLQLLSKNVLSSLRVDESWKCETSVWTIVLGSNVTIIYLFIV